MGSVNGVGGEKCMAGVHMCVYVLIVGRGRQSRLSRSPCKSPRSSHKHRYSHSSRVSPPQQSNLNAAQLLPRLVNTKKKPGQKLLVTRESEKLSMQCRVNSSHSCVLLTLLSFRGTKILSHPPTRNITTEASHYFPDSGKYFSRNKISVFFSEHTIQRIECKVSRETRLITI